MVEVSGHEHASAVASYLRLWKRWWAIVGDRTVMTFERWENGKRQEIIDLIEDFAKLKSTFDV